MNMTIMDNISAQDGGILKLVYANLVAISKVATSDNSISEESKEVIENLKFQTDLFIQAHKKDDMEKNFTEPVLRTGTS